MAELYLDSPATRVHGIEVALLQNAQLFLLPLKVRYTLE
jgi:hypothetical protein